MTPSSETDGRTRILDAAIALFSQRGFAGASVRDIAARAGVTGGLVVHHFGTKAALREACDARVVESVVAGKRDLDTAAIAAMLTGDASASAPTAYLRRMLLDDDERADALFDRILEATRREMRKDAASGRLAPGLDADELAAALAVYGLAPLLLPRQLARAFGADRITPEVLERTAASFGRALSSGMHGDG